MRETNTNSEKNGKPTGSFNRFTKQPPPAQQEKFTCHRICWIPPPGHAFSYDLWAGQFHRPLRPSRVVNRPLGDPTQTRCSTRCSARTRSDPNTRGYRATGHHASGSSRERHDPGCSSWSFLGFQQVTQGDHVTRSWRLVYLNFGRFRVRSGGFGLGHTRQPPEMVATRWFGWFGPRVKIPSAFMRPSAWRRRRRTRRPRGLRSSSETAKPDPDPAGSSSLPRTTSRHDMTS